ncbi:hypothetical protein ACHAWO_013779 [Cyclotella atomus]|uniref:Procollagen-proline 4-dioxygenase n=1 Tax=Cyclotella atomus TaxID=382360 RepID=A0ABD3PFP3_9STRA
MARQSRQLIVILAACLLSSSISIAVSPDEKLCSIDSTTEECKAAYDTTVEDADAIETGATEHTDLHVATNADNDSDDEEEDNHEEDIREEPDWSVCMDRHEDCATLAEENECQSNPGFMYYQCAQSCDTCEDFYSDIAENVEICTDNDPSCFSWAKSGECAYNPNYMHKECRRSCLRCFVDTNQFGLTQTLPGEDHELFDETLKKMEDSIEYVMKLWDDSNPDNDRVNYKCRNMDEDCTFWAAQGECENNPDWMSKNCAPACQTCNLLDIRLRCPFEEGNNPAFQPGDLNALMERIVDNSDGKGTYLKYNPTAISRPLLKADGSPSGVQVDGPWIVQFENFISRKEADALIDAGARKGYERSADVGEENPDGTHEENINEDRTSENAWCDEKLCNQDPVILPVIERIASVTETPVTNSEHLQLLRYEAGQFYKQHHDYIEYQQELPCGPRALTLFLYLNDVEEGGGTRFPLLDITVQPKLGNAILWPSVLDDKPESKDPRTDHEALEVTKGIKYGE